jgi:hypothetical protein
MLCLCLLLLAFIGLESKNQEAKNLGMSHRITSKDDLLKANPHVA